MKILKAIHLNHWVVILITLGIWFTGLTSNISNGHIEFKWGKTIPSLCIYSNIFDLPCWGCGLSRSIILAIQGKIMESFQMHIVGLPILIILTSLSIMYLYRLFCVMKLNQHSASSSKSDQGTV
jgi:hypothetical protein